MRQTYGPKPDSAHTQELTSADTLLPQNLTITTEPTRKIKYDI